MRCNARLERFLPEAGSVIEIAEYTCAIIFTSASIFTDEDTCCASTGGQCRTALSTLTDSLPASARLEDLNFRAD